MASESLFRAKKRRWHRSFAEKEMLQQTVIKYAVDAFR